MNILFILILTALAWIIPIIMLAVGFSRLKTRPKQAKILIIASCIWLIIGFGYCGFMFELDLR